jgi:hypothetical protein
MPEELRFTWDGLAEATARAAMRKAAAFQTAHGGPAEFDGLTEREISSFVEAWLVAAGFDVYCEWKMPGYGGVCDLFAESWDGVRIACELKVVYEAGDNRLNARRFTARKEIIGDVERLIRAQEIVDVRLFVLFAFARSGELVQTEGKPNLRLADVEREVSRAARQVEGVSRCEPQRACVQLIGDGRPKDWARWGHVWVWGWERAAEVGA